MDFEAIRYERQGAVAIVTLNRPERLNAISTALREELHQALDLAQGDDGVRVLVITGEGRGFCAGADLSALPRPGETTSQADKLDDMMWMGRFALALHGFDKPMICAVNGVAAGGGMGLALAADIRVGSEQTRFKTVFAERALGPDCGVSYFLPRIIGYLPPGPDRSARAARAADGGGPGHGRADRRRTAAGAQDRQAGAAIRRRAQPGGRGPP